MKQFKFYWMALVAMFAWSFTSCSDDDTPGLEPEPEETVPAETETESENEEDTEE